MIARRPLASSAQKTTCSWPSSWEKTPETGETGEIGEGLPETTLFMRTSQHAGARGGGAVGGRGPFCRGVAERLKPYSGYGSTVRFVRWSSPLGQCPFGLLYTTCRECHA